MLPRDKGGVVDPRLKVNDFLTHRTKVVFERTNVRPLGLWNEQPPRRRLVCPSATYRRADAG